MMTIQKKSQEPQEMMQHQVELISLLDIVGLIVEN